MIVYDRFWKTLKEKGITQYALINQYHISTGLLDRLRKNENINTYTINNLCHILHCNIEDIARFVEVEED